MTTNKFETIFTEEEKKEIVSAIEFRSLLGISCPINTEDELIEWGKNLLNKKREEKEKEALAKAKKEAKEIAKATEMGLTLEEYRKEKNRQRNIKRIKNEIEKLEKELARKKEYLKKLEG